MTRLQQPDWRRIGKQVLWIAGVFIVISAVLFVINRFFVHRELWDWLQLLIVPAVLAGGGFWFNSQQTERGQQLADNRAQDEALQAYLDQISDMLIPSKDRSSLSDENPPKSLRSVARARTLTVLPRLDGDRKARVVQFLYESGLIAVNHPIVAMRGAVLSDANLSEADLIRADLSEAVLSEAVLSGAVLIWADLSDADLRVADLSEADLSDANLKGVTGWTEKQLTAAKTLEGATMPDGQTLKSKDNPGGPTFEEWLRSCGKGGSATPEQSGPWWGGPYRRRGFWRRLFGA